MNDEVRECFENDDIGNLNECVVYVLVFNESINENMIFKLFFKKFFDRKNIVFFFLELYIC